MRKYLIISVFCMVFLAAGVTVAQDQTPCQSENRVEYLAVFMDGHKIGHGISTRTVEAARVTTTETMTLAITRGGTSIPITISETSIETPDGKPLGFETTQQFSGMVMQSKGTLNSLGKLDVESTVGTMTQKQTIDWSQEALMAQGARLQLIRKNLKEGDNFTVKVFSAALMTAIETEFRIGATKNVDLLGRVVPLTEVTNIVKMPTGNVVSITYTDHEFNVQKADIPIMGMNIELIACNRQFATSENDVADFIERMCIPSPVPLENFEAAQSITYHLTPKGQEQLKIYTDENQTARPDGKGGLLVTVKPVQPPSGAAFPYKGKDKIALESLEPTRFLQSDDKTIIALARRAVGDTKDAAQAAKKIESFVHDYIDEKNLSVGYASAAEVAASRQGDCSEHAVLTAALCRAVGIPARVAMGDVYCSEFAGRKNIFGGHAWNQAYIGGKWIGLDATRAPNGYAAGHITEAVGNGNPEDFFALIHIIGQFDITEIEQK